MAAGWNSPKATALIAPPTGARSAPAETEKIDLALRDALQSDSDQPVRVIVRLRDATGRRTAAFSAAAQAGADGAITATERQQFVSALRDAADQSQRSLLSFLYRPDVSARVRHLRAFWIVNAVALSASRDVIEAIARRADVERVYLDERRQWITTAPLRLHAQSRALPPLADTHDARGTQDAVPHAETRDAEARLRDVVLRPTASALSPGDVAWGVARVNAPAVWRGLGVRGEGVVVAAIDTGVDWTHPALQSRYRGWNGGPAADHLHNWFDATHEGAVYPSDLHGHGTHVMGTMVGLNGIGVAPGARWMAAKGLDGSGAGYYSWLHAAFQFMLAPNGNPAMAPHIVNNSWGSDNATDTEFTDDIAALRAAGIFVVFANGNNGPAPGTVGSPASLPQAVGVGASDPYDNVARFSSRGPSPFGSAVRPHVVAPGVGVRSSAPGGAYWSWNGTSMAAPHVAGVAALVKSAAPALDPATMLFVLTSTAKPLSTTIPNNDSGWGLVDALRAVLAVTTSGAISGQVLYAMQPVSGALVTVHTPHGALSQTVGADGAFGFALTAGVYTVTAAAFGFYPSTSPPVIVQSGQVSLVNLSLSLMPSGIVRGVVTDVLSGAALTQTLVRALGTPKQSRAHVDEIAGYYVLNLPAGTYTIEARLVGYQTQRQVITVTDGGITDAHFALTPTQRLLLVDSGDWYYASAAPFYRQALDALGLGYDEHTVRQLPHDTPTITQLRQYDAVIWSSPFDSPALIGAHEVISAYLRSGGKLMLSGQDVAFYDGYLMGIVPYLNLMQVAYQADDVSGRTVLGRPSDLLSGRVFSITGGDGANNQSLVDAVLLRDPDRAQPLARYEPPDDARHQAGVFAGQCLPYRSAFFAFGFEAISSASERATVMRRVLDAFDAPKPTVGVELQSRDAYFTSAPVGLPGSVVTHALRVRHVGDGGVTDTITLTLSGNQWDAALSADLVQLAPCSSTVVIISHTIPLTVGWDARDTFTVTATSVTSPAVSATISFTSKSPAPVLLVDDDRFFDREAEFLDALAANGNLRVDRWDTGWRSGGAGLSSAPTITALRMYPLVIWFNGYDWFDPLREGEAERLQAYLDSGGRLLISSQAMLYYLPAHPFTRQYLGVGDVDFNDLISHTHGAPSHPLGEGFGGGSLLNALGDFPYNWNLGVTLQPLRGAAVGLRADSRQPAALAQRVSSVHALPHSGLPGHLSPAEGRSIFLPFALELLTDTVRADLLNRAVGWLSWLGQSSLVPHARRVMPGDRVTFTLRLTMDESPTTPTLTQQVAISVSLSSRLTLAQTTLNDPAPNRAGEWRGALAPGDVLTFTFVVTADPSMALGEVATATLHVTLEDLDLHFTRDAVVQASPALTASLDAHGAPFWNRPLTVTFALTNTGAVSAADARATIAVPFGLRLITTSVQSPATGTAIAHGNVITWHGGLSAGESVTLTYAISLPANAAGRAFYHAAWYDNGGALPEQVEVWIAPRGVHERFLPLVRR